MMKRLFALLLFSSMTLANSQNEAKVTGNTYLGVPDSYVTINLNENTCSLRSLGNIDYQRFLILLVCGKKEQVLWHEGLVDIEIDDPRFELLWAGDLDGDNRLDLKMEVSPKYSCSQQAVYLSSRAINGDLVGSGELGEEECC
ncbi:hypothetical protein [Vibrio parahaemolyticus]|uniref:hypothetical protein n=1 Tax=Vibrio parahaemolyticus TaxID=670 RepID=UPI0005F128D8|nr:hypothetical protein [Vibrio parahaemolyticus]TOO69109.1 hypothetical protein CGH31_09690 [Vibrio parahaemolyticus]